jgi:hypothetical protein
LRLTPSDGATAGGPRWVLLYSLATALGVALAYGACAWVLFGYPWDWSPDEGIALDYGRRLLQAPETLYPREAVPFPAAYTPLLPVLMAPVVAWSAEPLRFARFLACAWTILVGSAAYALVRSRSGAAVSLATAALVFAPVDLSYWYLLIRVDGPMVALWLLAAAFLLPARLERGTDRLSRGRLWGGALALLGSVLAKPTALVHALPLVLGWFLVDRDSGRRLCVTLASLGLALLLLLEWLTSGGFLWTMSLWGTHPRQAGLLTSLLVMFLERSLPIWIFAATGLVYAGCCTRAGWRDGAWLLLLGGLLGVPLLSKSGAWWNYMLPALCGAAILGGRLWGVAPDPATPRWSGMLRLHDLAPAAVATLALGLVLTRTFPLPSNQDAKTAEFFYTFLKERGRPILATQPEYAYFLLDQVTEMEGSSFPYLAASKVAGVERIRNRIAERWYRTIVAVPHFWPADASFESVLTQNYTLLGECALGFHYGRTRFVLFAPHGSPVRFQPPPGVRCRALEAGS